MEENFTLTWMTKQKKNNKDNKIYPNSFWISITKETKPLLAVY